MIPGFDPVSAQRRLQALAAAIQAFPEERQAGVLRQYLEVELDRLEAMEDSHQAYLAECVLLAIDNMQDARLQSVEERLAALENPDGPYIADVLTEAAFVFALTLTSWLAVEGAGAVLLLWTGQAATAPLARTVVEEADDALLAATRVQVESLSALKVQLKEEMTRRRGLTTVVDTLRSGNLPSTMLAVGKALMNPIATAKSIGDAMGKTLAISGQIEEIQTKIILSHLAMAERMEVSVAARINYNKALLGDAATPNAKFRSLLDNATGGLALSPMYTVFQGLWKLVPGAESATTPAAAPFIASVPAGRLLTLMRENRIAVKEEYSVLRAGLRARPDETFIEDRVVGQLTELANELAPLRNAYQALEDSVRPLVVRGYEAALWWAYLQTNGILAPPVNARFSSFDDGDLEVGSVVEGHVIKGEPDVVTTYDASLASAGPASTYSSYRSVRYPGAPLLPEDRAAYLYETFAGPYFRSGKNARSLPFAKSYDPARYDGVLAMPKRLYAGFMDNTERVRRLDEMRLMVILFFAKLPEIEDPTSSGLLSALGELRGSPPSAAAWIALHPAAKPLVPPDLVADGASGRAAQHRGPALAALLSDSGVLDQAFYSGQINRLQGAVNELRSDIADLERLAAGEIKPGQTARGLDEEGYQQRITAEQTKLLELYDEVRATASFDPAELEIVEYGYDAIVKRLAHWRLEPPPTTVPSSDWKLEPQPDPR